MLILPGFYNEHDQESDCPFPEINLQKKKDPIRKKPKTHRPAISFPYGDGENKIFPLFGNGRK